MAWFGGEFYAPAVTDMLWHGGRGLLGIVKGRLQQNFVQLRHHLPLADQRFIS